MGPSTFSSAPAVAQKKPNPARKTPREIRFDAWSPPLRFPENLISRPRVALAFLKHHFRGLDHSRNRIADLQIHFLGASLGNHALNRIFSDADSDMRHHAIDL